MEFIKKFAKEISVFGLVLVIFLGLLVYRNLTFKNYKTISETKMETKIEDDESFIVVLGDSTDSTTTTFQDIMAEYTTKNRDTTIYYVDTSEMEDADAYMKETFGFIEDVPVTIIIEEGEVKNHKQGALTYYYLKDFIEKNT